MKYLQGFLADAAHDTSPSTEPTKPTEPWEGVIRRESSRDDADRSAPDRTDRTDGSPVAGSDPERPGGDPGVGVDPGTDNRPGSVGSVAGASPGNENLPRLVEFAKLILRTLLGRIVPEAVLAGFPPEWAALIRRARSAPPTEVVDLIERETIRLGIAEMVGDALPEVWADVHSEVAVEADRWPRDWHEVEPGLFVSDDLEGLNYRLASNPLR